MIFRRKWKLIAGILLLTLPIRAAGQTASTIDLSTALDTAAHRNPAVLSARQVYEQAVARVDQARAQARPTVSYSGTGSESSVDIPQPPPPHETFGTIENAINVPLPVGPKARLAVAQAQAQSAAALATYAGARRTLLSQVIADYFDLLKKQAQLKDAQVALADAQRQLEETTLRNKAGDVPDLDVVRAKTPVAQAQSTVIQAESAVTISQETFDAALGGGIDSAITPAPVTSAPATDLTRDAVIALAVDRSTDLQAAQDNIRAQKIAIENDKLWQVPSLSLQVSDTRSGDVTSFSRQDMVQAMVTIPLDDGGLARGQQREAQAALAQAQADYAAASLNVQTTAASAYLNADSARRVADSNKVALDVAQTAYDKSALGYKSGLFPLTDVLSAQTALVQARNAYTESLYDAAAASAQLNLLVGRLAPDQTGKAPQ